MNALPAARGQLYDRLQRTAIAEVPISLLYGEQQGDRLSTHVHGLGQRTICQPTFSTAFLGR